MHIVHPMPARTFVEAMCLGLQGDSNNDGGVVGRTIVSKVGRKSTNMRVVTIMPVSSFIKGVICVCVCVFVQVSPTSVGSDLFGSRTFRGAHNNARRQSCRWVQKCMQQQSDAPTHRMLSRQRGQAVAHPIYPKGVVPGLASPFRLDARSPHRHLPGTLSRMACCDRRSGPSCAGCEVPPS